MRRSPAGACLAVLATLAACAPAAGGSPDAGAGTTPPARAESLYSAGAWDSAGVLFRAQLAAARADDDVRREAEALTWLGLVAYRQGEYPNATRLGREALDLKRRHGLDGALFQSYNALGLVAWQESRYHDAVANFDSATALARSAGDSVNLLKAWNNLALVLIEFGDYARARELLARALPVANGRGERRFEGRILANLGMLAVRTGETDEAFQPLRAARDLAAATNDYPNELNVLGQLASAFGASGEPGTAIAYLDSALQLARDPARGSPQDEASTLALLGEMYAAAGDRRRALRAYNASIALDDSLGLPHERGAALRAVAAIHAATGNAAEAEAAATEALAAHRALGTQLEVLRDLLVLAELAHSLERPGPARSWLTEASSIADRVGSTAARAAVDLTEARIADREGRWADVLRRLSGPATAGSRDREWEVHHLRMRAHRALGQRGAALREGRLAIAAVERIRGDYGAAVLRTAYLTDRAAVFGAMVELLLEAGLAHEALAIADAGRGRAVAEHVAARREGGGATARELAEEERLLLHQVDALAERLMQLGAEGGAPDDLKDEHGRTVALLEQTRAAYDEVLVRSARREARASAGLDLNALRAALDPDEALVEFLVTERAVFTFVLTADTLVAVRTAVLREELATRARVARELAGRPDAPAEAVQATYASLGRILLGSQPVLRATANRRRMIVVPHADLMYVPFAALIHPATGRLVGEDFGVLNLPAASLLPALRGRPPLRGDGPVVVFAPFPDRLRHTAAEARAVRFEGLRVRHVTGTRATEGEFRAALARAPVVHAATHGWLNASSPLFSRLDFARRRGQAASPEDDGRLDVHEVLGLSSRAQLVFLSGCETGVGPAGSTWFDRGEDVATLSLAFLQAGASNVVATLWRVEDEAAAAFASRFYAALADGMRSRASYSLVDAVAGAQRTLREDPRYRAPYFWAAYTLNGSGVWHHGPGERARSGAGFPGSSVPK